MIVNLKEHYPDYYEFDYWVDVPDEVGFWLHEFNRLERNWQDRMKYHFAFYSLDRDDGIENAILFHVLSAEETYFKRLFVSEKDDAKKKAIKQLENALSLLTEVQYKRIYQHFVLKVSKERIAKQENVAANAVKESINAGVKKIKKYFLKNS